MYFDNVAIYMEQNQPPGSYGDSCAETNRIFNTYLVREKFGLDNSHLPRSKHTEAQESIEYFRTPTGYVRHHDIPEDWKETDFSSDQGIPLAIASKHIHRTIFNEFKQRIKDAGYKTGNGDLITPGLWGILHRESHPYIADTITLAGALILKYVPWRWSDAKETLETTEGASGDYLNLIQTMFDAELEGNTFISSFTKSLFTAEELYAKLEHYYKPEPDSQWVLDAYKEVLFKMFRSKP